MFEPVTPVSQLDCGQSAKPTQGRSEITALKGGLASPPYRIIWFSTEPPPAEPPCSPLAVSQTAASAHGLTMIVTLAGSPPKYLAYL